MNNFIGKIATCALLSASISGLGLPSMAIAQSDDSSSSIQEIIVTASRREQSLQDVGFSVTAFDEQLMENFGIVDVTRLELVVPGVNYSYAGNDAKFNVRGANSTNTFSDNASIVGTFVDGVYKPRASQQSRAFFDVERVEYLRGPQGTLYGRNTFAGALNLFTKAPSLAATGGFLDLGVGEFSAFRVEGAYNLPVGDTFALRVAALYETSDGYIENDSGPNMGAPDDLGVRLSARWQPSDTFDAVLRITNVEEKGTIAGLFGYKNICRRENEQGLTDGFGAVLGCTAPHSGAAGVQGQGGTIPLDQLGPWDISQDFVDDGDLTDFNATLSLDWDIGNLMLSSITSYSDFENLIGFDFDYSSSPHTRGWFDERAESWSQELQLTSNFDGPFQFTTGVYYSEDESYFAFSIFDHTVEIQNRPEVVGPDGNTYTVLTGTPIVDTTTSMGGFFGDSGITEAEALGVFTQGEFALTDSFRLIAGIRYSDESKDTSCGGSNFTAGDAPVTVLFNAGDSPATVPDDPDQVFAINCNAADAASGSDSWDSTDWRAGIEWDIFEESMLYLVASTGFLSGASNASSATFTDQQESEMIELGLKSTLADGRLQLNVAAHATDYKNLLAQFQIINPVTGTVQTQTMNGGEIKSTGLEVESIWLPTENLQLGLNAAFLDSEFGEYGQVYTYQLFNNDTADSFINVNGTTTPWSPETTFTLWGSYDFDLGSNGLIRVSAMHYNSDGYNTSNLWGGDPNHQQGSFGKSDIRATWKSSNGTYSLTAFVENIEDEAVLARGNNGAVDNVQTGYLFPRNWGIRFRLSF